MQVDSKQQVLGLSKSLKHFDTTRQFCVAKKANLLWKSIVVGYL